MGSRIITVEQSEALHTILSDLLVMADADAVFVCDCGGNIMDHISQSDSGMDQTIAALASGSFAATGELALLIGEAAFRSIFHKGDKTSIYMQSLAQDYLILVIFGKNATLGMVKLHISKMAKDIESLLQKMSGQTVESANVQSDFAMKSAGEIFKKKTGSST